MRALDEDYILLTRGSEFSQILYVPEMENVTQEIISHRLIATTVINSSDQFTKHRNDSESRRYSHETKFDHCRSTLSIPHL